MLGALLGQTWCPSPTEMLRLPNSRPQAAGPCGQVALRRRAGTVAAEARMTTRTNRREVTDARQRPAADEWREDRLPDQEALAGSGHTLLEGSPADHCVGRACLAPDRADGRHHGLR